MLRIKAKQETHSKIFSSFLSCTQDYNCDNNRDNHEKIDNVFDDVFVHYSSPMVKVPILVHPAAAMHFRRSFRIQVTPPHLAWIGGTSGCRKVETVGIEPTSTLSVLDVFSVLTMGIFTYKHPQQHVEACRPLVNFCLSYDPHRHSFIKVDGYASKRVRHATVNFKHP